MRYAYSYIWIGGDQRDGTQYVHDPQQRVMADILRNDIERQEFYIFSSLRVRHV